MKRNKLLISVTTTKTYQYMTYAETEDLALDEFTNQTGKRLKLVDKSISTPSIEEFIINKPKGKKK